MVCTHLYLVISFICMWFVFVFGWFCSKYASEHGMMSKAMSF